MARLVSTREARNHPGDLFQMQLHGVGAQNLGLRKLEKAGGAHFGHARLQLRNVFIQMQSRRRDVKAPGVGTSAM